VTVAVEDQAAIAHRSPPNSANPPEPLAKRARKIASRD
jgi:hypothetical protein